MRRLRQLIYRRLWWYWWVCDSACEHEPTREILFAPVGPVSCSSPELYNSVIGTQTKAIAIVCDPLMSALAHYEISLYEYDAIELWLRHGNWETQPFPMQKRHNWRGVEDCVGDKYWGYHGQIMDWP